MPMNPPSISYLPIVLAFKPLTSISLRMVKIVANNDANKPKIIPSVYFVSKLKMRTIPIIIIKPIIRSTIDILLLLLNIGLKKLVNKAEEDKQTSATEMVEVLIE